MVALVAWGIWRAIVNAQADFAAEDLSWQGIRWGWIAVSGTAYFIGLLPMAFFWRNILNTLGEQTRLIPLMRAYFVGHLGKYVPGKAMVIVLRTGILAGEGVNTAIAAVSVFIETLTMMSVGAFIAAITLVLRFRGHQQLQMLAIGLAIATLIPTLPPVLRFCVRRVKRLDDQTSAALANYSWPTVIKGWILCGLGWLALGVSLVAVLRSMPYADPLPDRITTATTSLATVCLAMVAGFFSLIPGGMGVREWIINQLLIPQFGSVAALFSAILLRLVWLVTELCVSAILELWARLGTVRSKA